MALYNEYKAGREYHENNGLNPTDKNWGSYQYVSLFDIVNNFMLYYQGNHEVINNISRSRVLFHAKRGIQELNYDALKEVKVKQLDVSPSLRYVLPMDFVNWVRISQFKDGLLIPMHENIQTNFAKEYVQDNLFNLVFDENGRVVDAETSKIDLARLEGNTKSIYMNPTSPYNGYAGWDYGGVWYFDFNIGARTGLNTETANQNPTFRVDKKGGVINFSSEMSGQSVVLEYISDGMEYDSIDGVGVRNDEAISVNKMFEEYIYAYIAFSIVDSKFGIQEYIVNRYRKKKSSLLRNARIRMSNMHPGRLLMNLRGQHKMIK